MTTDSRCMTLDLPTRLYEALRILSDLHQVAPEVAATLAVSDWVEDETRRLEEKKREIDRVLGDLFDLVEGPETVEELEENPPAPSPPELDEELTTVVLDAPEDLPPAAPEETSTVVLDGELTTVVLDEELTTAAPKDQGDRPAVPRPENRKTLQEGADGPVRQPDRYGGVVMF